MANLGHDSLVAAVAEAGETQSALLDARSQRFRIFSFDIRAGIVPRGDRAYSLTLGSGGPGHIDPRLNDGVAEWSMGITDSLDWEAPLFEYFDAVRADPHAHLVAVCHTYGLLCHWSGLARATQRPTELGRRVGVHGVHLTADAARTGLFDGEQELTVMENRQFDLLPTDAPLFSDIRILGQELRAGAREPVVMAAFASEADGYPRLLGVNFHPELRDQERQEHILAIQLEQGLIDAETAQQKHDLLASLGDAETAAGLRDAYQRCLLRPIEHALSCALKN